MYKLLNFKHMSIPKAKLKAILRYFCTHTDPRFLGKIKLMKLFYFIDFGHIKKYGLPITYDTYINLENGPIPSKILNMINSVVDDPENAILSDTIYIQNPVGKMQQVKCHEEFTKEDEKYFSEQELNTLKMICLKFADKDTKFLINKSHDEAPWKETKEGQEISYTLASHDPDCSVEEEDLILFNKLILKKYA